MEKFTPEVLSRNPSKSSYFGVYHILVKCNAFWKKSGEIENSFYNFLHTFPDHTAARSLRLLRRNNYIKVINYLRANDLSLPHRRLTALPT